MTKRVLCVWFYSFMNSVLYEISRCTSSICRRHQEQCGIRQSAIISTHQVPGQPVESLRRRQGLLTTVSYQLAVVSELARKKGELITVKITQTFCKIIIKNFHLYWNVILSSVWYFGYRWQSIHGHRPHRPCCLTMTRAAVHFSVRSAHRCVADVQLSVFQHIS